MKTIKRNIRVFASIIILGLMIIWVNFFLYGYRRDDYSLQGRGTEEEPYLITCADDLVWLRDSVNAGMGFENLYFLQTTDIDLQNVEWYPIGVKDSGKYFYGTYDGGGYKIYNINIPMEANVSNPALFGQLGGKVANLGIESGCIEGDFSASIAASSIGDKAAVINCYNKATITGNIRAGGICENFKGGSIINCANQGTISAPQNAEILSYDAQNVINVYPYVNACSQNFAGSLMQFDYKKETNDVYEFLNSGIEYINDYRLFEYDFMKEWNN